MPAVSWTHAPPLSIYASRYNGRVNREGILRMITTTYRSPLGDIELAADARGLAGMWFADAAAPVLSRSVDAEVDVRDALSGSGDDAVDPANAAALAVLERTWAWLNSYFAGQTPLWLPPLHEAGTELGHAVRVALLEIPHGTTVPLGEFARMVAERCGFVEGPADAGTADDDSFFPDRIERELMDSPLSLVVPLHRVTDGEGSPVWHAAGADRARSLLAFERSR